MFPLADLIVDDSFVTGLGHGSQGAGPHPRSHSKVASSRPLQIPERQVDICRPPPTTASEPILRGSAEVQAWWQEAGLFDLRMQAAGFCPACPSGRRRVWSPPQGHAQAWSPKRSAVPSHKAHGASAGDTGSRSRSCNMMRKRLGSKARCARKASRPGAGPVSSTIAAWSSADDSCRCRKLVCAGGRRRSAGWQAVLKEARAVSVKWQWSL